MIERLLVPLDGSKRAEQRYRSLEELAQRLGVELHLIRAVTSLAETLRGTAPRGTLLGSDTPVDFAIPLSEDRVQHEADSANLYLFGLAQRLECANLRVSTEVRAGMAAPVILEYAKEIDASLIVMATHGRTGLGRAVYGSVADAVLRDSSKPVLLVRITA